MKLKTYVKPPSDRVQWVSLDKVHIRDLRPVEAHLQATGRYREAEDVRLVWDLAWHVVGALAAINIEPLARLVRAYRNRERMWKVVAANENAPDSVRDAARTQVGQATRDRLAAQALVREVLGLDKSVGRQS